MKRNNSGKRELSTDTHLIKTGPGLTAVVALFVFSMLTAGMATDGIAAHGVATDGSSLDSHAVQALPFSANCGQFNPGVAFSTRIFAGDVFVTRDAQLVYSITQPASHQNVPAAGLALRETFIGGTLQTVTGSDQSPVQMNHFTNDDQPVAIPAYNTLDFGEVYPGIRVSLQATSDNVEKIFRIAPGADPDHITLRIEGATDLTVADNGELLVTSEAFPVSFTRPVAFQFRDGRREFVEIEYTLAAEQNDLRYGFRLGRYDTGRELFIDPLLAATYLGGAEVDGDYEVPIAVAPDGSVFIASMVRSSDFPTTVGAFDPTHNGSVDIFVARFNNTLSDLLACTFLGGYHIDGVYPGVDMVLDHTGSVIVTTSTKSPDFPMLPNSYAATRFNAYDAVIAKLSNDLSTLEAATYWGGTGDEKYLSLAVDADNNIYISATTASYVVETTPDAYLVNRPGGQAMIISKFDPDLSSLLASSFLGGGGNDWCEDVAVDSNGNVFVTGWTLGSAYPSTPGSFQTSGATGTYNAFVSKLDNDLITLLASTYFCTTGWQFGYCLIIDEADNIYVSGHTASTSFPVTAGAYCPSYHGGAPGTGDDAFISKFDNDLADLISSTYLGGSGWEHAEALCLDGEGNIYVGGNTSSINFPTTDGAFAQSSNGGTYQFAREIFVSKLDTALTTLEASTYLGGSGNDNLGSLAVDAAGNVFVGGSTGSTDFPVTDGAFDTSYNGGTEDLGGDLFVASFDSDLSSGTVSVEPVLPDRRSSLDGAYPNPFNPATEIVFRLAESDNVRLSIFDTAGNHVTNLAARHFLPGRHSVSWYGQDAAGQRVASGTYLVQLETQETSETLKIQLVK